MPTITVGMPVYNGEKYIGRALDCLLDQTFTDFEILISDNGSSDSTVSIIEGYAQKDSRIRLVKQTRNKGALANFAYVLEHANSEFFLWRAYDDYSSPNYLEALHRCLVERPDCALAAATVERHQIDGRISARIPFPDTSAKNRAGRVKTHLKNASAGWMYGIFRLKDLKSAFALAQQGYPYPWAQDHLIVLPFILNERIAGTNDAVFYQLETGLSASSYRPTPVRDQWKMAWAFLTFSLKTLACSRLSLWEKSTLMVALVRYTNGKTEKYHRLVRRTLKDLVKF